MLKKIMSLILLGALCGACSVTSEPVSGVYLGLSTSALRFGSVPELGVTPEERLIPVASGLRKVLAPTNAGQRASVNVQYVVYGDLEENAVNASAHALVVTLANKDFWEFTQETFPKNNEAYLDNVKIDGAAWKEHLLFQDSAGDWISSIWEVREKSVPQRWIGKRWSKTINNYQRIVLEYREQMPECVNVEVGLNNVQQSEVTFESLSLECTNALQGFNERSNAAFNIMSTGGDGFAGVETGDEFGGNPDFRMNFERLIGSVKTSPKVDKIWFGSRG